MTQPDERDQVHPETRAQWRSWLAEHHATSDGVWLISWRRQSGRSGPTYEDVVQEALCFGWIDSKAAKLDDDRTMMWVSPRKRGSGWARSNKLRIERLLADGLMAEAGLAMPDDLAAAFADNPGAREHWDGFPRSVRRAALEWIVQAKRPETRARRVTETARLAARGERPGQWRPRS